MEASTITVHWHNESQPIYSVDFQKLNENNKPISGRLVTGGGDNNIRMWKLISLGDSKQHSVEYLSTLHKHTQAVNVVRFNPAGNVLASAGDDGTLMLWKLSDTIVKDFENDEEDDELKESWQVAAQLRSSTSEIMDLCWSPSGEYIVTGSMDNILRVYQLENLNGNGKVVGKLMHSLKNHNHYIQGVSWDPLNQYIASQSADRSVNIYRISQEPGQLLDIKLFHKFNKFNSQGMYYSETLQSFFRRLSFSPDGSLLATPAGLEESAESESSKNVVYVYSRASLGTAPVFKLRGLNKPAIAISFHPGRFKSVEKNLLSHPYTMIFAIATQDSIVLYSTEEFKPLGFVSNLHYSTITDLKWDIDGSRIIVSSTDGFCSVVSFEEGVFGEMYVEEEEEEVRAAEQIIIQEPQQTEVVLIPTSPASQEPEIIQEVTIIEDEGKPKITPTIDSFFSKNKKPKKRIAPTLVTQ
ncbi:CAC2 [[Candida] subhashii]|uniref:CAC2 n=1 Tax=[Candida] subhashii TaxID=561895 RepID=A0A8J5QKL8_9ASCO|nr:CAC2 [[Candida] subhashii]KAG7663729.1 CAC2 [[Candida] subhashii]